MGIRRTEVIYAWTGYSGELPKRKRKVAAPPPPATVKLTHQPTGISVSGEAPRRRLSRRALQEELLKLRRRLFHELEKAVARARMKPRAVKRRKAAPGQ